MTTLLINASGIKQFDQRIRPVFEARGITIDSDPFSAIVRDFQDEVRPWRVILDVPADGSVHRVRTRARRPAHIHDCTARFDDRQWAEDTDQMVTVESTFGRIASCKQLSESAEPRNTSPRQVQFLAFSGKNLTILSTHVQSLDAFFAVDVWPHETIPMAIAAQRVGRQVTIDPCRIDLTLLTDNGERFVTDCEVCGGDGALNCNKCDGSGDYLPRKTCPKCKGSGNYVGKYGDVMGDCRACDGAGHWKAKPCRACDGEGSRPCFKCRGECYQRVRWDRVEDRFSIRIRDDDGNRMAVPMPPEDVVLQNTETGLIRDIAGGASNLIGIVGEASRSRYALSTSQSRQVQSVQRMIGGVSDCLRQFLDAVDPNPYDGPPIRLSFLGGTTRRQRRSAVYEFQLVGNNGPWQKSGECPLAKETPLRLFESDGRTTLPLSSQVDEAIANSASKVSLVDSRRSGGEMTFVIRFPVEVDPEDFPPTFAVLPDKIPPGEKQQIRHANRFAHPGNRNHAVIPAMVVSKDAEFDDALKFYDSSIAGNPRQAEAVQMGLSNLGLSLLKGPPGTGKTTVITEIVRQRIGRGQRVLVTSKNHQAVVNVLEKLDEIGGIRMARHGSSKDPGETERRYLSGGVRTRVHVEVYTKSRSLASELEDRLAKLSRHGPAVAAAMGAAAELKGHRAEHARKIGGAEKTRDEGLAASQIKFERAEARNAAATEEAEFAYLQERKTADTNIRYAQEEFDQRSKRLDSLNRKIRGRSAGPQARKPGLVRSLVDRVSPDFAASTAALAARSERMKTEMSELESAIAAERSSVQDAVARRNTVVDAARRDMRRESRTRSETNDRLKAECVGSLESIHAHLRQHESTLLSRQRDAVEAAEFQGEACGEDETEEFWRLMGEKVARDHSKTKKEHDFVRRWVIDLEADPTSVGQCYWDHLQVFFSTCVGIASWKELIHGTRKFDYAIVDEAATVTTGETVMPLMYAEAGMLVGDEMQLPPYDVSEGNACGEGCQPMPLGDDGGPAVENPVGPSRCWLSTSFFEYLWRSRPTVTRVMLDTQYRMNPRIASFVGEMFYPEGLHSGVSEADRTLRFAEFTEPMCLISTSAYNDRFEDYRNETYQNDLEARIIRRVLLKAEQQLPRPARFGIITPYAGQVVELKKCLKGDMSSFKKARLAEDDIASVNSFQGSQRDVIIVSFVRSPNTCPRCGGSGVKAKQGCVYKNYQGQDGFDPNQPRGECRGRGWLGSGLTFVQDLRRLNVALSRAKSMVILVGDIEALTNPKLTRRNYEGREVLEKFERYVSDTGLVLRVWETGGDR